MDEFFSRLSERFPNENDGEEWWMKQPDRGIRLVSVQELRENENFVWQSVRDGNLVVIEHDEEPLAVLTSQLLSYKERLDWRMLVHDEAERTRVYDRVHQIGESFTVLNQSEYISIMPVETILPPDAKNATPEQITAWVRLAATDWDIGPTGPQTYRQEMRDEEGRPILGLRL